MRTSVTVVTVIGVILFTTLGVKAQQSTAKTIPRDARFFVAQMPDGFDTYLKAAIERKKVPISLVAEKSDAQFEITGVAETQKASTAKKVIMWDWRSNEQASIRVNNLTSGEVVFAYSVNKTSSAHGKQSTAEACAKHLKEKIDSGR